MTQRKTSNPRFSTAYRKASLETRFHLSYEKTNNGCWLWIGHTNNNPDPKFRYGTIVKNHKRILAHRFSWSIYNGTIDVGLFVCHKCDIPLCVNPEHLFIGTPGNNMEDRDNKGRQAKGEKHGQYIHGKYVNQARWRTRTDGSKYFFNGNTTTANRKVG